MDFKLDKGSDFPYYKQIAYALRTRILEKKIPAGYKLPSERNLADELQVHRNTVVKAYALLVQEGLLHASRQSPRGYFVCSEAEEHRSRGRFFPLVKRIQYEYGHGEREYDELYELSGRGGLIPFGSAMMDRTIDTFPDMSQVPARIFRNDNPVGIAEYLEETQRTKKNICAQLQQCNMYVRPSNVQLLAQTKQGISHLISLFLRPGDTILAEEPMEPDDYSLFINRGIRVVTVPLDQQGICIDVLEKEMIRQKPKFLYTMPNYHNPTGITMSLKRRYQVLELASYHNVPIIEDDTQRELTLEGERPPSLYALDQHHMTLYFYSFDQVFPYHSKIAYAVGPADVMETLGYVLSVEETLVGNIGQYFLNSYIECGAMAEHIERIRQHYRRKRDLLCGELDRLYDKGLSYLRPLGGVILWCTLAPGIDEKTFFQQAKNNGVLVYPGSVYITQHRQKQGHVRLSYSLATDEQILEGAAALGKALDSSRR